MNTILEIRKGLKGLILLVFLLFLISPPAYGGSTKLDEDQQDSVTSAYITDGTILDADINANAGIAKSKISATGTWGTSDLPSDGYASTYVNVTGDTMTNTLTFSGAVTDITTGTNENLALMPNGTGKVGIGTTNPGEKLEVGGNVYVNPGLTADVHVGGAAGRIYSGDENHSIIIKGDRARDVTQNKINYYEYGDAETGHHFWTGGLVANQSERFRITNNYAAFLTGNVGIGTTGPITKLNLSGGTGDATTYDPQLALSRFSSTGNNEVFKFRLVENVSSPTNYGDLSILRKSTPAATEDNSYYTSALYINGSTGNVGIGTTTVNYKLDVNGDVNIASGSHYKINGTNLTYTDVGAQVAGSYLTSLTGAVLTDQTSGQTIGVTSARLTKLWATDITVTNTITGNSATASKSTNLIGGNNTTLLGEIPYQSDTDTTTLLPPNTTTTKKFLRMTGANPNGAIPAWDTVTATDVGLSALTNNKQVVGLSAGTTTGHFVSWGADGYTPADSGYSSSSFLTSVTAHNLLSTTHGDTTADTIVRGDIITGQGATPKWARLAFPATPTGKVLQATATDIGWSTSALGTAAFNATGDFLASGGTAADSAKLGGSLPAAYALAGQTMYIGTTSQAINRTTAAEGLSGITGLTPNADFTLTQNGIAALTSVESGALVNTLYLKAGKVGIGTTGPYSLLDVSSTTGGISTLSRNDATITAADTLGTINFWSNDTQTTTNPLAAQIIVTAKNTIATDINPGVMKFYTTPTGVAATPTLALTLDEGQAATFANTVNATTFVGALTGTASGNLTVETNSLETKCTGIATTEIPIGTSADTVTYAALSGDVTMANTGAVTIADNSHAHDASTISGLGVADFANGTDGNLITWDAAGAPALVATGNATQVLTSNGAGAAPTFQAAGGACNWTLSAPDISYVAGNVGIGTTAPTAYLHLKAGVAGVDGSPFKLTTGVVNTIAELGALEFTDPNLYFTVTDTTVERKGIVMDDGTTLVTSRIPFAFTNGRLVDSSLFTFSTSTGLTLTDLNMVLGTTTGTKFGTATSQKLAFFNSTPIVQVGAAIDLGVALSNLGLRAAGTAYPITTSGAITFTDNNIALGTTTGTKFGTATSQKLAFFNSTPIVQVVATTDLGVALSNLGLRAAGTAYPITTSGAVTLGSLTATRVPFAGTAGLLSDSANMTYVTNRLSPTYLTLGAGTTTAGTAPLKFTSGTLLTAPEAGTLEYLTDTFYIRGTDKLSVNGNVGIGTTSPVGKLDVRGEEVNIWTGAGTNTYAVSSGELYVEGDLEVDATSYLRNAVIGTDGMSVAGAINQTAGASNAFTGHLNPAEGYSGLISLGNSTHKWSDLWVVNAVHTGDVVFDNDFILTEVVQDGNAALAFVNPAGEKVVVLDNQGNLFLKGEVRQLK